MNVYTYYEPIFKGHSELLELWNLSWSMNGWTPIVIGEPQFRLHPYAERYDTAVKKFPTLNDRRYELACFRRWVAMVTIGGLMTDADVLNRSFKPEHLKPYPRLTILCEHRVPCVVFGTPSQYLEAASRFKGYAVREDDVFQKGGRKLQLVEDMTILRRSQPGGWFDEDFVCVEYGCPGWEQAALVHCGTAALGHKRALEMERLMS